MKFRFALAIGLCSLAAATCSAATITVGPSGQYPTIQQGVNAANAGDTVLVQPGTYQENVTITVPITYSGTRVHRTTPERCRLT